MIVYPSLTDLKDSAEMRSDIELKSIMLFVTNLFITNTVPDTICVFNLTAFFPLSTL